MEYKLESCPSDWPISSVQEKINFNTRTGKWKLNGVSVQGKIWVAILESVDKETSIAN